MSPKVGEVRLLVALLDPTGESPEEAAELARELIEALDRERTSRQGWCVLAQQGTGQDASVASYGPWSTIEAARKAAQLHGPSWPVGGRLMLAPSYPAPYLEEVRLRAAVNAALCIPSEKERVRALAEALGVTQKLVREAIDKAAEKARPSTDYVKLIIDTTRQLASG